MVETMFQLFNSSIVYQQLETMLVTMFIYALLLYTVPSGNQLHRWLEYGAPFQTAKRAEEMAPC